MIENIALKRFSEDERLKLSEEFPDEFRLVAGDDGYTWQYDGRSARQRHNSCRRIYDGRGQS